MKIPKMPLIRRGVAFVIVETLIKV